MSKRGPRKPKERRNRVISISVTQRLRDRLFAEADHCGESVSAFCCMLLWFGLKIWTGTEHVTKDDIYNSSDDGRA